jgi:hypothetical protein
MSTNTYEVGDRIRIRTTTPFADAAGTEFDPQVVSFEVKEPGEDTAAYVYGDDANVTKIATGDYACAIDVNTVGAWQYYVKGETGDGENRGAAQGSFRVVPKRT